MILTKYQVKEKLNIGDRRLELLMESGKLIPVNKKKEGAKKFFAKFNSKDVDVIYKEMKANGKIHSSTTKMEVISSPQNGILTRLSSIEEKLDLLIKMWR